MRYRLNKALVTTINNIVNTTNEPKSSIDIAIFRTVEVTGNM